VLRADVLAHATHEEEVEFPMLRSMLTDEGLREMATEMASVQSGQPVSARSTSPDGTSRWVRRTGR